MTRGDHRRAFTIQSSRLALHVVESSNAFRMFAGDDRVRREGAPNYSPKSQHSKGLADDYNLYEFRNGGWVYLTATTHHIEYGKWWESLSPYNRWGGRFKDGNHYERLEVSRHDAPHRWGWFNGQQPLWVDDHPERTA